MAAGEKAHDSPSRLSQIAVDAVFREIDELAAVTGGSRLEGTATVVEEHASPRAMTADCRRNLQESRTTEWDTIDDARPWPGAKLN